MTGDPLDRDLVVVMGKGGVGRSTVSAALGLAAARRGRRVVVAEVAALEDVPRLLTGGAGAPGGDGPERRLAPGLRHVSIDPDRAITEYLREQLPLRLLADALHRSRVFTVLTAATPGMRELLTIGKVAELVRHTDRAGRRRNDLVVLDAPATGHGLALLAAPRTFAAVARFGPVAGQSAAIDALLRDPERTAFVAVARPEEMPVSEVAELRAGLRESLDRDLALAVMNGVLPARFTAADAALLDRLDGDPALRSARWLVARRRLQEAQRSRLRRLVPGVGRVTLPFRFRDELGPDDVARFATRLGRRR